MRDLHACVVRRLRVSLALLAVSASAYRLPTGPKKNTPAVEQAKVAAVAAALSASLIAGPAVASPTSDAAVALADAAYPIIGELQSKTVAPLTGKVVSLALTSNSKEIIKTIDMGLDAFLSSDSGKFIATVKALKAATAEATGAGSCNLICLPPVASRPYPDPKMHAGSPTPCTFPSVHCSYPVHYPCTMYGPQVATAEKVALAGADALSSADAGKVKGQDRTRCTATPCTYPWRTAESMHHVWHRSRPSSTRPSRRSRAARPHTVHDPRTL